MKILSVDQKSYQFIAITIRKKSLSNVHRQKRFSCLPKKTLEKPGTLGAGNEIRTRDTKLGKLVLYQLSYARFPEKNI